MISSASNFMQCGVERIACYIDGLVFTGCVIDPITDQCFPAGIVVYLRISKSRDYMTAGLISAGDRCIYTEGFVPVDVLTYRKKGDTRRAASTKAPGWSCSDCARHSDTRARQYLKIPIFNLTFAHHTSMHDHHSN